MFRGLISRSQQSIARVASLAAQRNSATVRSITCLVNTQNVAANTSVNSHSMMLNASASSLRALRAVGPLSHNRFMSVDSQDSDPQFKPQVKKSTQASAGASQSTSTGPASAAASASLADSEEMQDMLRQIKEVVTNNKIVLFMKGSPDAPQCGFSGRVVKILSYLNISYESCNVLDNSLLREGIKIYSDWPTIPQLYVQGEFIGGADIVTSMFTSGELHELLGVAKPETEESQQQQQQQA